MSPEYPGYPRTGFTNKRPVSVEVLGSRFSVDTWRDVLVRTCEVVNQKQHVRFETILELEGQSSKWFSRKPEELRDPLQITKTALGLLLTCGEATWETLACHHLNSRFVSEFG